MPIKKTPLTEERPIRRKVVEIYTGRHWLSGCNTRRVVLECGHKTYTWAKKKARCFDCERERRTNANKQDTPD